MATPFRMPFARFHSDESGGAYSVSLVLTAPIYALLIATVVESALLMNARVGVQYAAHAAARAASVWGPAEAPVDQRMGMIHLAATHAMAPFASGRRRHSGGGRGGEGGGDDAYREAYVAYSGGGAPGDYLRRKWRYAAKATAIDLVGPVDRDAHDAPVTVEVTYYAPINIPLVGRFLGTRHPAFDSHYVYRLTAQATMGLERPRSEDHTLGIAYGRALGFESDAAAPAGFNGRRSVAAP